MFYTSVEEPAFVIIAISFFLLDTICHISFITVIRKSIPITTILVPSQSSKYLGRNNMARFTLDGMILSTGKDDLLVHAVLYNFLVSETHSDI